jgi:hypothetical protein
MLYETPPLSAPERGRGEVTSLDLKIIVLPREPKVAFRA